MNRTNVISGTVILVTVLVGLFVLAWHKTILGVELVTIVTAIIGIAGGAFAHNSGVNAGASAAAVTPPPAGGTTTVSTTTPTEVAP